jgi:CheY-like chemotaxis protein
LPGFGPSLMQRVIRHNRNRERTALKRSQICQPRGSFALPRILIVDDDPMIRTAICTWLEDKGFEVAIADGAESGLNALEHHTFDLMIVDIFMPHMHGFESVRLFHQRAPRVPLIAISGYVFAENRLPAPDFLSMALDLGASRCLRKPFTPTTLLAVIDACLSEAAVDRKNVAIRS